MPRLHRVRSNSGIYHVMMRGVNKQTIFEDDEDRQRLLETLKRYKNTNCYDLYGYCLMDNHIHLLMREVEDAIGLAVKRISSSYVHWYNKKYDRYGNLFQGRFRSECIETIGSLFRALRYIHQNPLKAGLSSSIFESEWTSIHEYLGNPRIVNIDFVLDLFSQKQNKILKGFTEYMQEPNDDEFLDDHVKVRFADSEVLLFLNELGIKNISELQQMNRESRNAVLMQLKEVDGVSVRQLSRVTGVSKSVIDRLRETGH